mmetsp:Transcript_48776/g.139989  ORF Transcript_48776/g.139989 Transcript_48776/m.139989 type:complete len:200 (+) Transcript_48776:1260-1859(+)
MEEHRTEEIRSPSPRAPRLRAWGRPPAPRSTRGTADIASGTRRIGGDCRSSTARTSRGTSTNGRPWLCGPRMWTRRCLSRMTRQAAGWHYRRPRGTCWTTSMNSTTRTPTTHCTASAPSAPSPQPPSAPSRRRPSARRCHRARRTSGAATVAAGRSLGSDCRVHARSTPRGSCPGSSSAAPCWRSPASGLWAEFGWSVS